MRKDSDDAVDLVPSVVLTDAALPPSSTDAQQHAAAVPAKRALRKNIRPSTAEASKESYILPSTECVSLPTSDDPDVVAIAAHAPAHAAQTSSDPGSYHTYSLSRSVPDLDTTDAPGQSSEWSLPSKNTESIAPDYNWATFVHAYALGMWDPHKTPTQPRFMFDPQLTVSERSPIPKESPRDLFLTIPSSSSDPVHLHQSPKSVSPSGIVEDSTSLAASGAPSQSAPQGSYVPPLPSSIAPSITRAPSRRASGPAPLGPHRLRNSLADIRSSSATPAATLSLGALPPVSHPDVTTTAAAMRWAAAGVNLAPLALPSPEHELTDPMRNARAVIPDSLAPELVSQIPPSPSRGTRTRGSSFWQVSQPVANTPSLPPIQGSPATTPPFVNVPSELSTAATSNVTSPNNPSFLSLPPPVGLAPATAPAQASDSVDVEDDYFGSAEAPSAQFSSEKLSNISESPNPVLHRSDTNSSFDTHTDVQSVPALSRRVILTRQFSAPLPGPQTFEHRLEAHRTASDATAMMRASRAIKEETMFVELGYVPAPYPPDELERRRALNQFNIRNSGSDVNFDRIEHLTKLVFNTKVVLISLIDSNEQ